MSRHHLQWLGVYAEVSTGSINILAGAPSEQKALSTM
jgi:hypothetical protein